MRACLLLVLALAVVPQLAVARAPKVARECKTGVCKKAINRCVKQSCSGLHGPLKGGCTKAAKLTIRQSCNLAADHLGFCNDIAAADCTPDR